MQLQGYSALTHVGCGSSSRVAEHHFLLHVSFWDHFSTAYQHRDCIAYARALLCFEGSCLMCARAPQVSSFGSLPRAMSTAASLGETAAAAESRRTESSMSKVESIASTAVRAAAKMDVSLWPTQFLRL